MSWVRGPLAPRLPVRRSTVLLVVVFIGLLVLYFSVRTEKIDYNGGLFDVTERDDGVSVLRRASSRATRRGRARGRRARRRRGSGSGRDWRR